jgi:putative intracellular protease/amidase
VALLDDDGAIGGCVLRGFVCLDVYQGKTFWARRVSADDVRAGVLDDYDVLVVSGGKATVQSKALGETGQDAVRAFVQSGGGYVGVCAGAYMAASEPTRYGLGLAPVRCVDTKHWRRGKDQLVDVQASPAFAELSGSSERGQKLYYANGPLLEPLEGRDAEVRTLLTFRSDVHAKDAPAGVMPGKLAALTAEFGQGRVAAFSIHPELTRGHEGTMAKAVLWAAQKLSD